MTTLDLHVGDVGIPFEVSVLGADGVATLDLSTATVLELRFQKPDGSMLVVDGAYTTLSTGGVVRYYLADGDLDQVGTWKFQMRIGFDSEIVWSDVLKIKVQGNLPQEA